MAETKKIYFYPIWLRIWHGVNALGIILLIITGISLQSGSVDPLIEFNSAINLHNISGIIVTISYLIFILGNLFTNNKKFYVIKPKGFLKRPMKQAIFYTWGMFKGENAPYPLSEKRKFNPLQKYFYVIVMYLAVPMIIITGIGLFFPEIIIEKIYHLNGIFVTAVLHSAMGFFISIFLLIHIYVSSIGKSPIDNFKSILTGWHHIKK
ncbi:MAG: cytochrome b/b6 domain-containing protein [Mariniphaga sp.]|nr:cytochrome b/b6 domain-containing protein [Mariniphaga sp.]